MAIVTTKACPFCAETIQAKAIKCRFCGERVAEEEKTLSLAHPALRSYLKWVLLGTLLLPLFGAGLLIFVWIALDRAGRQYRLTNRRLIVQKGLISKNIDEINLKDIRNINTRQNAWHRLIGYGDVIIGTAATSGSEILIEGISRPVFFKEMIAGQKG